MQSFTITGVIVGGRTKTQQSNIGVMGPILHVLGDSVGLAAAGVRAATRPATLLYAAISSSVIVIRESLSSMAASRISRVGVSPLELASVMSLNLLAVREDAVSKLLISYRYS